ncbi:hypothetical protein GOV06_04325 [Candidatus Woesearchaeota archaeon]|nr:hypothetical protein [Candidatus Woesearchaeota archaeon]
MATRSEWAELIKHAARKERAKEIHERNVLRKFVITLKKLLTVELLIGLIAALSLYIFFGWAELARTLLNWIIGITLATTVVAFMINRYKKLLHLVE